jgi:hypothetical protein
MKTHRGVEYISTIPDLGTRWRWVVSFMPRPLYTLGNRPPVPLDRRLGGPQSRYGRCGQKKSPAPTGNRTSSVQLVTKPTEPSRLFRLTCLVWRCEASNLYVMLKILIENVLQFMAHLIQSLVKKSFYFFTNLPPSVRSVNNLPGDPS